MRAATAILVLAGCSGPLILQPANKCVTDVECGRGLVCFPDGCGDPGSGIVVEVTGDNTSLHPQDFVLHAASATEDLYLRGPLLLTGSLQKNAEDNSGPAPYIDGITITANGESANIPGQFRSYTLVLPRAEQGGYQMPIGAGKYLITARPHEKAIPMRRQTIMVAPGSNAGVSFLLPAIKHGLALTGRLVKVLTPSVVDVTGMTIQAFDATGGAPLSQVFNVNVGGQFQIYLDDSASFLGSITLVATPTDSTALVPTKSFVISPVPAAETSIGTLELGDFGAELPQVKGRLVGSDGAPVAGAIVSLEGKVTGDGTFKSRRVVTDANGVFAVDLLASAPEVPFTLTAIPPQGSPAGAVTHQVRVGQYMGKPSLIVGDQPREMFTCPDRLLVSGKVIRPEGGGAFGVQVEATPIEAIDGRPLPSESSRASTDREGNFELLLDTAKYRLDYIPSEKLPRKSRVVRVEQTVSADAGELLQIANVGTFSLSEGRTVTGVVTVRPNSLDPTDGGVVYVAPGTAVQNALVRFYRVTQVEGVDSALLIGEAYTDPRGNYSVVLPDRPPLMR